MYEQAWERQGSGKQRGRVTGIAKLDDANDAGLIFFFFSFLARHFSYIYIYIIYVSLCIQDRDVLMNVH